jgi:hypothetical protein
MSGIAIAWAGFVGTTVATAFYWLASSLRLTRFSPTVLLGCLITRDPRRPITDTVGLVLMFAAGSTLLPALVWAFLSGWAGPPWIGGVIVGGVLGLLVAGALPLYGRISTCVKTRMIPPPGPFGIGWGRPTPGIIFAGNVLYGAVVAAILGGF